MAEQSSQPRLVATWYSPYVQRVAIALRAKSIGHIVIEESSIHRNQRMLNANPMIKKLPILIHNRKLISDSRIILEYIDEEWNGSDNPPAFLPRDPYQRSAARFWVDYIENKIFTYLFRHLAQPVNGIVNKNVNDALVTLNKSMCLISHGSSYFMSASIGLVDIVFSPLIPWFNALEKLDGFQLPLAESYPRLHEWIHVLQEHPSVKPTLEQCSLEMLQDYIINHIRSSDPLRSGPVNSQ